MTLKIQKARNGEKQVRKQRTSLETKIKREIIKLQTTELRKNHIKTAASKHEEYE